MLRILARSVCDNREIEVRHDLELHLLASKFVKRACVITDLVSYCIEYVKERYLAVGCVLLKDGRQIPAVSAAKVGRKGSCWPQQPPSLGRSSHRGYHDVPISYGCFLTTLYNSHQTGQGSLSQQRSTGKSHRHFNAHTNKKRHFSHGRRYAPFRSSS